MKAILSATTLLSFGLAAHAASYKLAQEYSGSTFFDGWDFYGDTTSGLNGPWQGSPYDDTTNGDVFYMGRANGSSLYHVDSSTGHAFLKVDNTTNVPYNQKRNSIRINTKDFYNVGTVWVIDAYHLPWGCSVWPSIWTSGLKWPDQGEIDIVEGVNRMTSNQMALHTLSGCTASPNSGQSGSAGTSDCSPGSGCTVTEKQANSYGLDFANNGGGVWAAQFDTTGVFIWFWPRASVPASVTSATDSIDTSTFGTPSAAYESSTCDINKFFGPQQLIIDITLCGDWGKVASIYDSTCGDTPQVPVTNPPTDPNQRCYLDNVINNGTADYAMAYFELGAIRAYSNNFTASPQTSSSATLAPGATTSGGSKGSSTPTGTSAGAGASTTATNNNAGKTNAASLLAPTVLAPFTAAIALFSWILF